MAAIRGRASAPTSISHPANLFTLLAGRYEVNASEEATGLCPTSLCVPTPGTTLSHLAHGKVARFRGFVASIRPRPRPTLWFKHVLLPHVPWQFYPSGTRYRLNAPEPIPGLNGAIGFGVPWLVKVSYQRHLLQLGLADRLLGELLARLRRLGLYRDALVVVVADHGIGFHVGVERRTVTRRQRRRTWRRCRCIVKLPGQRRGRIVDQHVETIDVLPTILELARIPAPVGIDGRSLLRPVGSRRRAASTVFHRVGHELNTVGGDYTLRPRRARAAPRCRRPPQARAVRKRRRARPEALYRIGPHPELIGRRAASLPRAARDRPQP